jgi:RNA polymerase sigma-70 factor (ECF subfamily)
VRHVGESHLIKKAKSYDAEALSELYRRHADTVFRYVFYRVGDRQAAEDLVGDVFVRALEGLSAYQDTGSPFEAWLYRIAHARVVDYYRRQESRRAASLDERLVANGESDLSQWVAQREDVRRIWDALRHLTDDQQLVISLRFIAGYSTAEVARVMGKNEGAIRALQYRALASLRRFLEIES